jgi:hypothetical protein
MGFSVRSTNTYQIDNCLTAFKDSMPIINLSKTAISRQKEAK